MPGQGGAKNPPLALVATDDSPLASPMRAKLPEEASHENPMDRSIWVSL